MTRDLSSYDIDSLWLDPMPRDRTILIAYPHPDDESFSNAGTILRYTARGVAVHYACATRGECGTVDPELLAGYPDIAALRTAELACAARALGLAAVHFLGYRDSGMPGADDNEHPAALVKAPLEQVAGSGWAVVKEGRVHLDPGPRRCDHPGQRADNRRRTRIPAAVGDQDDRRVGRDRHACRPHSVLSNAAQRPARGSSPAFVRRVHGQQPIDVYPCLNSSFTGTFQREM